MNNTDDKNINYEYYEDLFHKYIKYVNKDDRRKIRDDIIDIANSLKVTTELDEKTANALERELERQEKSEQTVHSSGIQRTAIIAALSSLILIHLISLYPSILSSDDVVNKGLYVVSTVASMIITVLCISNVSQNYNTPRIGTEIIQLPQIMKKCKETCTPLSETLQDYRIISLVELHMVNYILYRQSANLSAVLTIIIFLTITIMIRL